ncbi:ribonuclease III [Anaerolentibacter hominis]|uniref:ribonuclease III n=1 Tax=Anaerolentibacter hominis TaxID=3079009 RepID=UPI0031B8ABC6
MKQSFHELCGTLKYTFKNEGLLRQAMTHSTFSNEHGMSRLANNERLEFLGDAVLEVATSDFLYRAYPNMEEGDLSKLRASIVCEPTLADVARELNLGEYLMMGRGEDKTGGRKRDSILSDAVEALIGAIYLDGGFTNAKEFVSRYILNNMEHKKLFYDSKTILQEMVQENFTQLLSYRVIREEGPDHDKMFTVQAFIGEDGYATGSGKSKKAAEQKAAYGTILMLKKDGMKCI